MKKALSLLALLFAFSCLSAQDVNMDFDVTLLHGDSTLNDSVCVVFVVTGDGYTATEQSDLMDLMKRMSEQIIMREPFYSNRAKVKVYGISVISEESGISTEVENTPGNTFFRGCRQWGTMVAPDAEGLRRKNALLARYAPRAKVTSIIYNKAASKVGDCSMPWEGLSNLTLVGVTFHEHGHSFYYAADERFESLDGEAPNMTMHSVVQHESDNTKLDTAKLRWKNFLGLEDIGIERHEYNGKVGYTPNAYCAMGFRKRSNDLCLVCLAAATEKSAEAMGEPFYGTLYNGANSYSAPSKPLNTQTEINFPSGFGRILDFAFHGCDKLQTLTIPEDVMNIGKYAFLKCTGLRTITNYAVNPQPIKNVSDPFYGVDRSLITLHVVAGTAAAYEAAGWTGFNIVEDLPSPDFYVVFNAQGGTLVPSQINLDASSLIDEPADPTRAGHTFHGWFKDADCTQEWHFESDVITQNITLYAKWSINTYTVTFVSEGGIDIPAQNVNYGGKITRPGTPQRAGYDFGGWYRNSEFTGDSVDFATAVVTSNTTLYAKWSGQMFTIIFESNGGTYVIPMRVSYGERLTEPTITRTDYTFDGWYTDATFINRWDFDAVVTSQMTLYAKWTGGPSTDIRDNMESGETTLKAWIANDVLHISGLTPNQPFVIYNVMGVAMYRGTAASSDITVNSMASLPHGTYIIQQYPKSFKIIK